MRPTSKAIKWNTYALPFSPGIWVSIGWLLIATSGIIIAIKAIAMTMSVKSLDSERIPNSEWAPMKIIHVVVHMTATVILAAYSAYLISFLAVKSVTMPFTTMEGLLKDGTYKFLAVNNTEDFFMFKVTSNPVLKLLGKKAMVSPDKLPKSHLDGLRQVCNNEKLAVIVSDGAYRFLRNYINCSLEPLDPIKEVTIALIVSKNNQFKEIINNKLNHPLNTEKDPVNVIRCA
ncbi:uncharacterized protein LOC105702636 [Orussus abietinus]|uniref:uncharacterized protein LOC105702636 n=1 Tax=Orussus abietinus TaxID=222816 RepID=UPI000C715EA9|nr:uncharacterized protein LOC105702636 [Orussus abietinus]